LTQLSRRDFWRILAASTGLSLTELASVVEICPT
jgi:hypothetical protein